MIPPAHELGAPHFQYRPFDKDDHHVIRLLSIIPLQAGESNDIPIRGYLDHVHVCKCALVQGETEASLFSNRPTIYFDRYVRNRPEEVFPIEEAHSTTLYEHCFNRPDPESTPEDLRRWKDRKPINRLTKRMSSLFKSSDKSTKTPPQKSAEAMIGNQLYQGAIVKLLRNPEDTGGGFSIYTPVNKHSRRAAPKDPKRPKAKPHTEVRRKFQWGNYIALSYSWGSEMSGNMVYLKNRNVETQNEDDDFGLIQVTKNLEAALRRFRTMRYFRSHGPVWIDALCINQCDEEEKSIQLSLMPHIYGCAGNILVWLGEGNDTLYEALDMIQKVSINYRTEWEEAFDDVDPSIAYAHREEVALKLRMALSMWKMATEQLVSDTRGDQLVYDFFNLPYWRRLWIIQELAMGTADMAFVLGERVTEWRYLRDAAFMFAATSASFAESLPTECTDTGTICHVARIAQLEIRGHRRQVAPMKNLGQGTYLNLRPVNGPVRGSPLWQAFRLMANAQCYDPRDRVFGILALPGLPNLGVTTDYTRSVIEIYTDFTVACIQSSYRHPFEIFCLLDGTQRQGEQETYPSWVPDFSSDRRIAILEGHFRAGDKYSEAQVRGFDYFDAAPAYEFVEGNLQVYACVIDVVDGLGGISKSSADAEDESFLQGLHQVSKTCPWPVEFSTPASAIWRCFVAGSDEDGTLNPDGFEQLLDVFSGEDYFYKSIWLRERPSCDFIAANADLLVDGRPLASYLPRWRDTPEMEVQRREDPHTFYKDWRELLAQTTSARQTMQSRIHNKRLMVTGQGMVGLVPNSVVPGDVVILVKGHGRPLIASKVESTNGDCLYTLKGEAYIDGMMAGEMMEDEVRKEWETITFV